MIPEPDDTIRNMGEIIKKMLEEAGMSDHPAPVIFNFKILVNMPGSPGNLNGQDPDSPATTAEPVVEVQHIGGEVILLTELPGISPENIQVVFSGSTVHIRACDGIRSYRASATVPPAENESVSVSFHHGVLEVTYREKTGAVEPAG